MAPAGTSATPESQTAAKPIDIVQSTEQAPGLANMLAGVYVTVVQVGAGHIRRRVYLSLAPAERAARSAEERGHAAEVVLCRLEPVGGVSR